MLYWVRIHEKEYFTASFDWEVNVFSGLVKASNPYDALEYAVAASQDALEDSVSCYEIITVHLREGEGLCKMDAESIKGELDFLTEDE